jgi:hypothetical protein
VLSVSSRTLLAIGKRVARKIPKKLDRVCGTGCLPFDEVGNGFSDKHAGDWPEVFSGGSELRRQEGSDELTGTCYGRTPSHPHRSADPSRQT